MKLLPKRGIPVSHLARHGVDEQHVVGIAERPLRVAVLRAYGQTERDEVAVLGQHAVPFLQPCDGILGREFDGCLAHAGILNPHVVDGPGNLHPLHHVRCDVLHPRPVIPVLEHVDNVGYVQVVDVVEPHLVVEHHARVAPLVVRAVDERVHRLAVERLNLRRARAEQLTPQQIVQLMLLTDRLLRKTRAFYMPHFTRKDVYECCGHFASIAVMHATETQTGEMDLVIQIGKEKTRILDPRWLPSHSELYRNHYHPAYRIISAAWAPYLDAICGISRCAASGAKILVTLDGSCACGKTTLAELLSDVFDADVIHTDEYVVPHAQKTLQRLSVPGGNCDWERLTEEVLIPWKKGQQGIYRPYDCKMDQLREMESFPDKQILILEGSYSNLPAIRKLAGVRLFLNVPYEERIRRLTVRESEESLKNYYRKWIPLEDAYFQAYGLPDDGMIVIHGASFASTDPC